jgi:hypothetical protein
MASNNYIFKMSNAGGMSTVTRYTDMLAGNAVWNPWEPQGAYDALSTVTLSTTTASIEFAGIPTGYKHLQIRAISRDNRASTANSVLIRVNGDTGSNYAFHRLIGDGSAASASSAASQTETYAYIQPCANSTANIFGAGIIDILDYSNTSKTKVFRTLGSNDQNGSGFISLYSGLWNNTSAINTIRLYPDNAASFVANTQFTLYGVR